MAFRKSEADCSSDDHVKGTFQCPWANDIAPWVEQEWPCCAAHWLKPSGRCLCPSPLSSHSSAFPWRYASGRNMCEHPPGYPQLADWRSFLANCSMPFTFLCVKMALCFHCVHFQPSSHTLGFWQLQGFNYSYYTAWANEHFLLWSPSRTLKGEKNRWKWSAMVPAVQMPVALEQWKERWCSCLYLETCGCHMEHTDLGISALCSAHAPFCLHPLFSQLWECFHFPWSCICEALQVALDGGIADPAPLALIVECSLFHISKTPFFHHFCTPATLL